MNVFTQFIHSWKVQFVPIISEFTKPTYSRVRVIMFTTTTTCFFIYACVASSGYMSYCNLTKGNLLGCYPANDAAVLVARVALVFVLTCSYPL